jgi:hypothetical protein
MATIINLKHRYILGHHVLIWWNTHSEFKCIKVNTRMYKKYSIYIGRFIFEIGKLKYGTNNKSVPRINK